MDDLRRGNNLTTDTLQPNQSLVIPKVFYTVRSGDSLSVIARNYQSTVLHLREANRLTSDKIRIGQTLVIPTVVSQTKNTAPAPASTPKAQTTDSIYTVVAGDSLSVIAQRFGTSVNTIREANNLRTDVLQIGQVIQVPQHHVPVRPVVSARHGEARGRISCFLLISSFIHFL